MLLFIFIHFVKNFLYNNPSKIINLSEKFYIFYVILRSCKREKQKNIKI